MTQTIKQIDAVSGRTEDFAWTATESNGSPAAFEASDKVRFKLARKPKGLPLIDLISGTPTPNGSSVSLVSLNPAQGNVRLAQGDTEGMDGIYHFEMNLVDDSETNPADAIKQFLRGTINFIPSQGGEVGM